MEKNSNDTFEGIMMFILFLLLYPLAPLLIPFAIGSCIHDSFCQRRRKNLDAVREKKEILPKERIVYYVDGVERIFCR